MIRSILFSAAAFSLLANFAAGQPPKPPSAPVVVADVVEFPTIPHATFTGTVHPARRSVIGCAVDGRVERLLVDVGDWVDFSADGKFPQLAMIRTATIDIEIAGAKAELEMRRHEEVETQTSRPEEIAHALARMKAAEALMKFARDKVDRDRRVFESSRAITREEVDRSESVSHETARLYEAAEASYKMAQDGPRVEKKNQAKSRVAVQEQEVNRLYDRLEKYVVKCPFRGYVVAKHTEIGAWVKSGDPVMEVAELDPVEIIVNVPEDIVVGVTVGMAAEISLPSLPATRLPGKRLIGVVAAIVPEADSKTRTFPVKVRVRNPLRKGASLPVAAELAASEIKDPVERALRGPAHVLMSGMLAEVSLRVSSPVKGMFIPKDAVVVNGRRQQIYVLPSKAMEPGMPQALEVQLGVTEGETVQIVSPPLTPGQLVIVEGNERIFPGMQVNPVKKVSTATLLPAKPAGK